MARRWPAVSWLARRVSSALSRQQLIEDDLQFLRGLQTDAEEQLPARVVDRQGFGAPTAELEPLHQGPPGARAHRLALQQLAEISDGGGPGERVGQPGLGVRLQGRGVQLPDPGQRRGHPGVIGELTQRVTLPTVQNRSQLGQGRGRVVATQGLFGALDAGGELVEIELTRLQPEPISPLVGIPAGGPAPQQSPESGHLDLQRVAGRRGRPFGPQGVDQHLDRYRAALGQGQLHQDRPVESSGNGLGTVGPAYGDRSQEAHQWWRASNQATAGGFRAHSLSSHRPALPATVAPAVKRGILIRARVGGPSPEWPPAFRSSRLTAADWWYASHLPRDRAT